MEYYHEVRGDSSIPTVDVSSWPFIDPGCSAGDGTPPSGNNPPGSTADAAVFVSETLPDNSPPQAPGATLVKTWRMRNTGTTTWDSRYKLIFLRDDAMGAPHEVSLQTTNPGNTANISIPITVPPTQGKHRGYWQLWSPLRNGTFGPELWVEVETMSGPAPTPPPSGTKPDIELRCLSDCPGVVTPGQRFQPTIRAIINKGALLNGATSGHMLRATSDPNYTLQEHPLIAVVGNHYTGETYDFRFYDDHPIVAPTAEGTYESKWRVWRDNNWSGEEITIRFIVQNGGGTLPNVPTLSSPADGWTDFGGCPTSPQLCVQSQGAGIQFNFQIDPSAPQNSGWVSGPCWTPSSLGQTEHIWQVKAMDTSTGLESGWSSQRRFTCASTNYSIPYMLFSPPSPTSADAVKLWTCADVPSEVGRGIEVYANTATDGSNSGEWRRVWPVLNGDCTADWQNHPEWWPSEDLRFLSNGTHLIQARAWAGDKGNPIKSMVREAFYTLDDRRPAQVQPVSPGNLQWFNTRAITFRWEPQEAPRSQSYVLKVSTNPNPAVNPIVNQTLDGTAREFAFTFDQDYASLYWGVQACNALGCSDLGSVQFGIDLVNPSSLVNTLPITIYDTVRTVTWSCTDNSSGCQRYTVQVRDDALGQWQDWRSGVTEVAGMFLGLPGHHYCFRARALDNAANLEDWPADPNGDTCTLIDLDNQPQIWWNANYGFKRSITVLNKDGHTLNTGFPVHAHFDDTTPTTAAEIYNGSTATAKGNDVRVVYQNATEVSRFIQTFTPNAIDIWFDLQADIGPNPGNSADYQIYYGNSAASNPPADPGDVFMPRKDSGVVAAWYLSEWGGNTAADNSGNGHTATRVNGGQWVTTAHGPAIDLVKDSKQYLTVNDPGNLNLNNFTFEAWFWRDHSDVGALISKWRDGEEDSSYLFGIWQRKMMLRLRSTSGQFFETPESEQTDIGFQDNVGYHVAATYDGSQVRFYVNGELKYTKDWTGGVKSSSKNVFLGVQQSQNGDPPYTLDGYFDGLLGGIRISDYARTSFPYASFALVTNAPEVNAGAESAYESPTLQPDLAVLSLTTYPAPTSQGGGQIVQAVVKNQGTRATRNGAWTLAYADHQPAVGDLNGISFWLGTPVEAGTIATLTTYITRTSAVGMMSVLSDQALAESNHTLYVQADATGVTKDSNRANNISTGAQVCLANADAYEPNDTASAATSVAVDSTVRMNFHGTEDQDWVKFSALGGVTYTIKTFDLDSAADTYLYLYGTDGATLLSSNDDYDGSLASRIDWAAPATGTYYVLVKHWNPNVGGCGTGYSLSIQRVNSVASLSISGLAEGKVNTAYTFTATVGPISATMPVIYTWDATGQTSVTNTSGLTDSVALTWATPGVQAITVTASNAGGAVVTHHAVTIISPTATTSPESVAITGPTTGVVLANYTFLATVNPISATRPITFVWQATGQTDMAHTGNLNDAVTFAWTTPGVQVITVTATNAGGSISRSYSITIADVQRIYLPLVLRNFDPRIVHAGFSASPREGLLPLAVQFTDQSSGSITDWQWSFGDGSASTSRNPVHTYTAAGVYMVTLTVYGPGGPDTIVRNNYITVTEPSLVADFVAAPLTGQAPLTVVFTDTSSGPVTAWLWDLGDVATTTQRHPTHVYSAAGSYTVTLQVSGAGRSNTRTRTGYIRVYAPVQANFTASPTSGVAPLPVIFTNTSSGDYTASRWNFGDGAISTLLNPMHTYVAAGEYTVSLYVSGPAGSNALTRTGYISVTAASGLRYVAPGGLDSGNNCANSATPCGTVQYAVDVAQPGEEIRVAAGIYTDIHARAGITQMVYLSKTMTIRGGYTTANWTVSDPAANPTMLNAQGQGRVVFITGTITSTVEGFTLREGNDAGLGGCSSSWISQTCGSGVYAGNATVRLLSNIISNNGFTVTGGSNGGGAFLWNIGAGTLVSGNLVANNMAEWGGGLFLLESGSATLYNNTFTSNTSRSGGGLDLDTSDATLGGNTVISNVASYRGGGLYLRLSKAKVENNVIASNTSLDGGGVYLDGSAALLTDNTITRNAADQGGGVYSLSAATLQGNRVISNTATMGGGVYVYYGPVTLNGNTVISNTATYGGGLYTFMLLWNPAQFNGNNVSSNVADYGGGVYLSASKVTFTNTVIADNRSNNFGSGLYAQYSDIQLLHTTIARNVGGDGSGVYVTNYDASPSTVAMTNTVLVGHTVGLTVTGISTNTAILNGVLWYGNVTNYGGVGTITVSNAYTGSPAFASDGYHLTDDSAAIDKGIGTGVTTDIDGETRPQGAAPDLGADEHFVMPTLTVYSLPADGEIVKEYCVTWAECRGATSGVLVFTVYEGATIQSSYLSGGYSVKRVFLYFDTSSLPANAVIQSAALNFYAGPFQHGTSLRVHAVRSTQGMTLTVSDFSQVTLASGGFADLSANTWAQIPLNAAGLTWIVKGSITKLALVHDLDVNNVTPAGENSSIVAMAEDATHPPYLTIRYTLQ